MMKRLLFSAVFAAFFLTLSRCALTEQSLRNTGISPLSQSELQALHARPRTFQGTSATGDRVTGIYTPEGVGKIQWSGGEAEGSWRIKDGKFCVTYAPLWGGAERCFTVYKTGDNEYKSFHPDGALNVTASYTN